MKAGAVNACSKELYTGQEIQRSEECSCKGLSLTVEYMKERTAELDTTVYLVRFERAPWCYEYSTASQ